MVLNVVIGRNQHIISQCSSHFNRILFFTLKNLTSKKDNLINNDDIKSDWRVINRSKL